MNSLSLLKRLSRFGALALFLFCLLGRAPQAQAGYWGAPSYVWSGSARLKHLHYHQAPVEGNLYMTALETTNYVRHTSDPMAGSPYDYGNPKLAQVDWDGTDAAPGGNVTYAGPVAAPQVASFATGSVFAVLKWHRNLIFDTQLPDPADNPPKYLYVSEQLALSGQRTAFVYGGSMPAYDGDVPWPGDYVSVTGHAGSRDLQVALNATHWQYRRQSLDIGTAYIYTILESSTKIHRYAVAGDTVSLSSVSFSGNVKLSPGYERSQEGAPGNGLVFCGYNVSPINLDFSATPVGPYSLSKNTPLDKVYEAYTRWGAHYATDGSMKVEPFVSAQSAFDLSVKTPTGAAVFQDPIYQWTSSAATYIPVLPPPPPDENWEILLRRQAIQFGDDINDSTANLLPPFSAVRMNMMRPSSLLPQWYEHGVWMDELVQNAGAYPPEWDIHTSTPTKRLFWSNGQSLKIPPTTVTVKATDSNGAQVNGKIQINWHRPSQTVYDITLLPVEWQIPPPEEQEGGAAGNSIYTYLSDSKLLEEVSHDSFVQAAWNLVPEAGGQVLRVVFTGRVGAPFVANFFARRAAAAGINATAAEAATIGNNAGKVTARATEIGANGAAVETATSTQSFHLGTEPVNGGAADARSLIPDGEPSTQLRAGDGSGDSISQEVPPNETTKPNPRTELPPEEEERWEDARANEYLSNCFVAGTPVLMGDGTLKSIEQVQVGDVVESKDPSTGRLSTKKVLRTLRNIAPVVLSLTLGNGERIITTPGHPFATTERGSFVLAGNLPLKAQLQEFDGHTVPLISENSWAQTTPIYNFEVQDFHTYFVGKSHLWVHNDSYVELGDLTQEQRDAVEAARMQQDLLPARKTNLDGTPNNKTIGTSSDLRPMESGYGSPDAPGGTEYRERWDLTKAAMDEADGFTPKFKFKAVPDADLSGYPGTYNACHAEVKLRQYNIAHGLPDNGPIAVNNYTCSSCRDYFSALAKAKGKIYTIADPAVTRIFLPDGKVLIVKK
ncbi:hypothetical protein IAD21_03788 [Abditibacteriota bacterium]|nr:hypothetical protein IAD21_03788 [Abditibacteriota bacterium]